MKELLFEYLIETDQLEKFKAYIIDAGIETEGGTDAWVESELE